MKAILSRRSSGKKEYSRLRCNRGKMRLENVSKGGERKIPRVRLLLTGDVPKCNFTQNVAVTFCLLGLLQEQLRGRTYPSGRGRGFFPLPGWRDSKPAGGARATSLTQKLRNTAGPLLANLSICPCLSGWPTQSSQAFLQGLGPLCSALPPYPDLIQGLPFTSLPEPP